MSVICRNLFVFLFSVICNNGWGRTIWVSLFDSQPIKQVVLSAYNGDLTVNDGNQQFTIVKGQALYIALRNNRLDATSSNDFIGTFSKLSIYSADSSVVRIKPASPQLVARNYEDTISLVPNIDRIRLFNRVDEERYISGVVQAEVGSGRTPEFYKAKAVICRTYLYGHINRHENEGFHLCDETHCQAYKGKCTYESIRLAVMDSDGIILTSREDSIPILAAYHSNCGGETESAKNAWQTDMPYLVPVTDPYCVSQPNARWDKTISIDDWFAYMIKKGFKPDPHTVVDFSFQQVHRVPQYTVSSLSLDTKQIRADWQLRSAFFTISVENGQIHMSGKGYGHGVGLCQEGAMEMGRRGYKYDEIISFYYKYVNLVPVSKLHIRVPEFKL